ncbi:MAG: hypothetical protein ABFC73_03950, partial [Clostridiaceae bacterium]
IACWGNTPVPYPPGHSLSGRFLLFSNDQKGGDGMRHTDDAGYDSFVSYSTERNEEKEKRIWNER